MNNIYECTNKNEATNDIVIIVCPPLSAYEKQPSDQSHCTAVPCPSCDQQMWLSEKKKLLIQAADALSKDLWLECYGCFMISIKEKKIPAECMNYTVKI